MILRVDDKWSISYDPASNDRPTHWLRYNETHSEFNENNATLAMFYALLEAEGIRREREELRMFIKGMQRGIEEKLA